MHESISRRGFLGVGGAAFICTLGGKSVKVESPRDVIKADAAAAGLRRPVGARPDAVDALKFGTPEPAPGGQVREYWIQARPVKWDVAPTGRDDWMNHAIKGPRTFTAIVYQAYTPGFGKPAGPATMPGPTLEAEVGDVLRVHFRNGNEKLGTPHTMHPHGVRYTPDYDGAYMGRYTRVGGFVAPGEEFTYTWEALPESVGVWPYHDHGPNHGLNTLRGLFGTIIIREKGAPKPDVEVPLFFHSFPPQITGSRRNLQCVNGRVAAGNTPTVRAKVGQDVAFHAFGGDAMLHTFHVHGHRWRAPDGSFVDNLLLGPETSVTARWREDNPGRWLYHCHIQPHMEAGMAGWYLVDP
jgi:manganese oxidase